MLGNPSFNFNKKSAQKCNLMWGQHLQEKHAREEEERKRRIQLYVFVMRCIAYNFNTKQPNDMQKRHLKVTKEGHEKMKAKIEVTSYGVSHTLLITKVMMFAFSEFSPG